MTFGLNDESISSQILWSVLLLRFLWFLRRSRSVAFSLLFCLTSGQMTNRSQWLPDFLHKVYRKSFHSDCNHSDSWHFVVIICKFQHFHTLYIKNFHTWFSHMIFTLFIHYLQLQFYRYLLIKIRKDTNNVKVNRNDDWNN